MTPQTLIMLGDHHGSLAAARDLGRRGHRVVFADHRRVTPGAWSRFVARRVVSPPPSDLTAYADWLAEFGRANPGTFVYAVNDDLCWILARHQAELSRHFRMYQPDLPVIDTILDKKQLYRLAADIGVPCPRTWAPDSEADLARVAAEASYPVLIKPRTQAGLDSKRKGRIAWSASALRAEYDAFRSANRYHPELTTHDPSVAWPLVQEYLPRAVHEVFSVAGFADAHGRFALRASQKVFQRPRRLGVGVGFEARPVPEPVASWVRNLCRASGYYGAFEVEFIADRQGGLVLADFNPRYYGQMGFEIARGLPQPWLAWLGASGDADGLAAELDAAAASGDSALATSSRYAHGWILRLLIAGQFATGRLTREERRAWLRWLEAADAPRFDAIGDRDDTTPLWVDLATSSLAFARHPRDFVRTFCLDA